MDEDERIPSWGYDSPAFAARQMPYSLSLDPDSARELAIQGATLLLLNVPCGTSVGLDSEMFVTGPNFAGFKMIPPGTHFLYYCAASRHGVDSSPVVGVFLRLSASEVAVRRWEPAEERLVRIADSCEGEKDDGDEEEERRYIEGVRRFEFDSRLAPYYLSRWRDWKEIAGCISTAVIERHQPPRGEICLAFEADLAAGLRSPSTTAERYLEQQLLHQRNRVVHLPSASRHERSSAAAAGHPPATQRVAGVGVQHIHESKEGLRGGVEVGGGGGGGGSGPGPGSLAESSTSQTTAAKTHRGTDVKGPRATYTAFPRFVKGEGGISAADVTAMNMDKSRILHKVLVDAYANDEDLLIGEFQFAFVAFLMGQSLDAFRQWKGIIHLMTGCVDAPIHTRTRLFTKFVRVLHTQLRQGLHASPPKGPQNESSHHHVRMDEFWLSDDNFLRLSLKYFFGAIEEAQVVDGTLLDEAKKLRRFLGTTLGWYFDQDSLEGLMEDDEFAPVVVSVDVT